MSKCCHNSEAKCAKINSALHAAIKFRIINLLLFMQLIRYLHNYNSTICFYGCVTFSPILVLCNFACCFLWVWNLVVDTAGGKEAEGVWEQGVEENIWTRRDEVTGEWKRLNNEELNDFYSSPNIVRVIKSRRMRWVGHVARMGEERGCIGSWWGNRREWGHWGDLDVDGWIILGRISRRWDVGVWTELGWPRIETGGGRLWVR